MGVRNNRQLQSQPRYSRISHEQRDNGISNEDQAGENTRNDGSHREQSWPTFAEVSLKPVIITAELLLAPAAEGIAVDVAPSTTVTTTTRPSWNET